MNSISTVDYTEAQKGELRLLSKSLIIALIGKSAGISRPNADLAAWPAPTARQRETLREIKKEMDAAPYTRPTVVQEGALMQGGDISYSAVPHPHSTVPTVLMDVQRTNGTIDKWIVDVIPVEKQVLVERPGIGRITYFAASVTKIANQVVAPLLEVKNYGQLEVFLFNPDGVIDLCEYLTAMLVKNGPLVQGLSGPSWLDYLYRGISKCSMLDYVGLHALVLSKCLFIGSNKTITSNKAVFEPLPIYAAVMDRYQKYLQEKGKQVVVPKFSTPVPLDPAYASVRAQLSMVAYWTGDLPAERQSLAPPTNPIVALQAVGRIVSNRGGRSGPLSLLAGRNSLGLPSVGLAKIEEMLMILLSLRMPYNVKGLKMNMAFIYDRARKDFDPEATCQHRFVTDTINDKIENAFYYADSALPTIHFNYDTVDKLYHLTPKRDVTQEVISHRKVMGTWLNGKFEDHRTIYVGDLILPFPYRTTAEKEEIEGLDIINKMKCYSMELPFDGRGVFSMGPVSFAGVKGIKTNPGPIPKKVKILEHKEMMSVDTREWAIKVTAAALSVVGFLVHPPNFLKRSVAELVPTFKDVTMACLQNDEWEMMVSSEIEIMASIVIPTRAGSLPPQFDSDGNIVVPQTITTMNSAPSAIGVGDNMLGNILPPPVEINFDIFG